MTNQNFSDAFLEWRRNFDENLKSPQDPFSPKVNIYYYDIGDYSEVEETWM